ncbi:hypothetical protein [Aneurinibacillus tyrosinisolvens]|uniref:hypothetical protein n=1 Tax=Aneurinibacillus tyrosinisolvens TaxID=1443435 RepID=UPI00063F4F3A|nr:hypothetical protein [Aneurinibacillus tyrosinisolvens]
MICTFDPRLLFWSTEEYGEKEHRQRLKEVFFVHINWLEEIEYTRLVLDRDMDRLLNRIPWKYSDLYPEMRELTDLFLRFITSFPRSQIAASHSVAGLKLKPDICEQGFDEDRNYFLSALMTLINDQSDKKGLLTYEKEPFVDKYLLVAVPSGDTFDISVLADEDDWYVNFLELGERDKPEHFRKLIRGYYLAYYKQHPRYSEHIWEYVVTEEFIKTLEKCQHQEAVFQDVIDSLTVKIYNIQSGSKVDEKAFGRLYVSRQRGDRIEYVEAEETIYFLKYLSSSEHDDYKIR